MSDTQEYSGPWTAGPVKCLECGYEQVSVRPADLELMECGRCGQMTCAAHDWTAMRHGKARKR
ncbi:MAG TPA: hypothetical protein VFU47_02100 [Armatimonadota bacterium]|nr:hypothetical protein [Armatimonadota bacterium]